MANLEPQPADLDIAVVGLAGRFPGARNIGKFWENLCSGAESIRLFSEPELAARGVPASVFRHPQFVGAGAVLEGIDCFDCDFFGYSPREAATIDPQQRLFLECAWEALEDAGYASEFAGNIGVFGGCSMSSYLLFNLLRSSEFDDQRDSFPLMIANDKDFLCSRVSYALDLKGPSVTVQTGCSTSLTAVHLACHALLAWQCDVALAGGVSIHLPQRTGYFFQPGGINSPDGHCRAFDAHAQGTIFGSGAGIVALARLQDATQRGDRIYAIIRGSAINNDGAAKVGYTAPSLEGQGAVIAAAQAVAGTDPHTISYVEAHGTATALGDPIELGALRRAFGKDAPNGSCALGSVKSNIGHLDAAAGVAGLIKAVLSIKNRVIPPTLHFREPNPRLELAASQFYVNAEAREWDSVSGPRRAGVSSFGIGGSNAHVVLEEAPVATERERSRSSCTLVISARTEAAFRQMAGDLAQYLGEPGAADLDDIAFTLQRGRKRFPHRRAVVCRDRAEAIARLRDYGSAEDAPLMCEARNREIAFLFPGGGAQYPEMGRGLYETEPVFRKCVDECTEILRPLLGDDLRDTLYPADRARDSVSRMRTPRVGLPALAAVEYALARLWMSWGVRPAAMIGHSLGEYTAACIAGVFDIESMLRAVHKRCELFDSLPGGSMLAVAMSEEAARAFTGPHVSIAAINGSTQCVLSGAPGAIAPIAITLNRLGIECGTVHIDVAAHSAMLDPILPEFERFLSTMRLRPPTIPFVSNVTGTWIRAEEAVSAAYWARHLRSAVNFHSGIRELLARGDWALLEVGPGSSIITLARLEPDAQSRPCVTSLRHPNSDQADDLHLARAVGRLWQAGCNLDWQRLYDAPKIVSLPSYSFERRSCWIAARSDSSSQLQWLQAQGKIHDPSAWTYAPLWKQTALPPPSAEKIDGPVLIFADAGGIGTSAAALLRARSVRAIVISTGNTFEQASPPDVFQIDPAVAGHYRQLLDEIARNAGPPTRVIHLWAAGTRSAEIVGALHSLALLGRALSEHESEGLRRIVIATRGARQVESGDSGDPFQSMAAGPCMVLSQEYEGIATQWVDLGERDTQDDAAAALVRELTAAPQDKFLAVRGSRRWAEFHDALPLAWYTREARLRDGGAYLITGGIGNIGLLLAEYLAQRCRARVFLTTRWPFPPRREWPSCVRGAAEGDCEASIFERLLAIEATGGEVSVHTADAADRASMTSLINDITLLHGGIAGVIHLAGRSGVQAFRPLGVVGEDDWREQIRPKLEGALVLREALRSTSPDFVILFSSNASVLGGIGLGAYAAANLGMDALAEMEAAAGRRWISACWDSWPTTGAEMRQALPAGIAEYGMTRAEAVEMFETVALHAPAGRVVVSTGDLVARRRLWVERGEPSRALVRPSLAPPLASAGYAQPGNRVEETVARAWQQALGIERIGTADNFFEIGGNSLIALRVAERLRAELGVEVSAVTIFEAPTVRALAAHIVQGGGGPDAKLAESRTRGSRRRERRAGRAFANAATKST